jgi:hypothetical protein
MSSKPLSSRRNAAELAEKSRQADFLAVSAGVLRVLSGQWFFTAEAAKKGQNRGDVLYN